MPGTAFYADGQGRQSLRLSYCYPTPERIREGIRRLAAVVEEEEELLATFGPESRPRNTGIAHPGLASPGPDLT